MILDLIRLLEQEISRTGTAAMTWFLHTGRGSDLPLKLDTGDESRWKRPPRKENAAARNDPGGGG